MFLDRDDKISNPTNIDKFISAELPDKDKDPSLYALVTNLMIHGPCGSSNPKSPCMKGNNCSKFYPKRFNEKTYVDEEGYPCYKRLNDGATCVKNGVVLDNRNVVS